MKRRFEFVKGASSKFWEIEVSGKTHTVRFGRIGATGQTAKKGFPTPAAAQAAAGKLIGEKTKKGYVEAGTKGAAPKEAAGKPAGKAAKKKASPELLEAARAGDEAKVAKLLASGANPDSLDKNGATALMWAARDGKAKMAKALLAAGADADIVMPSEKKGTALGIAAKRGQAAVVKLLLAGGASARSLSDDVIERVGSSGNLEILCLLGRAGAGDAKLSTQLCERFAFLCETPHEKELLEAISWRVTAIKALGGGLDVKFGKEVVVCSPPFKGKAKSVPKSYAAIAKAFNGISWESIGGGALGFGGLGKGGDPENDWGWDSSYVAEGNESFLRALKKAKTSAGELTPAFGCAQNWLLFDPTRKNSRGEEALGFVSHESCEWEPVKSADKLAYGGVLLRLLANYFVGVDELDEVQT